MVKTVDLQGKPFHFIGIGGIGMSALAYILAKRKLPVSGSDVRSTHITERLEAVGAKVFHRQEAANLDLFEPKELQEARLAVPVGAVTAVRPLTQPWTSIPATITSELQVICSTAIQANNLEYQAARSKGYPIFHRSDVLAALLKEYKSIAVAGTHGKTTTSSAIGYLLVEGGLDPTIVIGGEISAIGGNARLGQGEWLVAEADESDGTLAKLAPTIGIITNIELDHPDHYQGLEEVIATFQVFAKQCEKVIGCIDCATVRDRLKPDISYSLNPETEADYTVTEVAYGAFGTRAQVWEKGNQLGTINLNLLGSHNLSNALAAISIGRELGLDFDVIAQALATFEGAKRRFEFRGERDGVVFFDDYAHHPSELRATLAAARLRLEGERKRLVAIFQPHRYSRTRAFFHEFAESFKDADVVILTDIYSAGEANLEGMSGEDLVQAIAKHHPCVYYQPSLELMPQFLKNILQAGDLALFLGAGNLNQTIPKLLAG